MLRLPGLFDSFDNLDQMPAENIARWLKPQPQISQIENYLAQRILYPQTVSTAEGDMKMDLAILREALRNLAPKGKFSTAMLGDNPFINSTLRKVLIPAKFLEFVPNLSTLTWAFVDGLLSERERSDFFEDLWTVVLTGEVDEVVGSILLPEFKREGTLQLTVLGKTYEIHSGSLMVIPCSSKRCQVDFKFRQGKILGKQDFAVEIYGGRLGLMIDGRRSMI